MKLVVERGDTRLELEMSTEELQHFSIRSPGELRQFIVDLWLGRLSWGRYTPGPLRSGSGIGFQHFLSEDLDGYPGTIPEVRVTDGG